MYERSVWWSIISEADQREWFQQVWTGITGASTRHHPAPFPLTLATRLIRMFSFVGDMVLDPFMGTATTNIAAAQTGRSSIGLEVNPKYFDYALKRIREETGGLFGCAHVESHRDEVGSRHD